MKTFQEWQDLLHRREQNFQTHKTECAQCHTTPMRKGCETGRIIFHASEHAHAGYRVFLEQDQH